MAVNKLKLRTYKPAGKPDLLMVLTRRKRTVQWLLEANQVTTTKNLQALLDGLQAEYDISTELVNEALTVLANQSTSVATPTVVAAPAKKQEKQRAKKKNEESAGEELQEPEQPKSENNNEDV